MAVRVQGAGCRVQGAGCGAVRCGAVRCGSSSSDVVMCIGKV